MYDEAATSQCLYHPGRFVGSGHLALVPHWSCCGEEQSAGCRVVSDHRPCETTRHALLSFLGPPVSEAGTVPALSDLDDFETEENELGAVAGGRTLLFENPGGTLSAGQTSFPLPASLSPAAKVKELAQFDTFRSVALRHGMTVEALAALNNTSVTRCLQMGQMLHVLRPALSDADEEARQRREMVVRFKRQQKCSAEESKYYLETNEFSWEIAVSERSADVSWERENARARQDEEAEAEREASLLISALTSQRVGEQGTWPAYLRPWENQLIRRCVLG
eukprot:CAMPEP_0180032016 /NCGR_PEP_ID=MMETSP0984-20121128/28228_1 /TAXON_ID=483367 /ORGANISM="non described non described, Strain CCMP 2436" /LENGTH=278 /DNA_ID=CAMNT_0021957215 /DNA_START=99 /DNA_END=936 /DNA_ORIENTATION=-